MHSDTTKRCREDGWRWQLQNAVCSLQALESVLDLTDEERRGVQRLSTEGLPMSITPHYLSLCDPHDPACPIRRQCVPHVLERVEVPGDMFDPLGEQLHELAPGLVQRYRDRVLLLITDRCAVYCRFCTRGRMVGRGHGRRLWEGVPAALDVIRSDSQIREVIISGGDPLLMPTERVALLLDALARIDHVRHVRVATRVLATLPQRLGAELCRALRSHPATWLMAHFNHPHELSEEARAACGLLVDSGIPIMNQTVLLRGINDDAGTLERLFRGLVSWRVRPYYLLQADPVRGTGHLRTPLATGINIMAQLQGHVSGIALPKLIVDTPGGRGKVPLGPDYVVKPSWPRRSSAVLGATPKCEGRVTRLRTFRGELVDYIDPCHDVDVSERREEPVPGLYPRALRRGDRIAVIAPGGPFDPERLERGVSRLRQRYEVTCPCTGGERRGFLAGDDDWRYEQLRCALEDRDVKAIVAARGGYGTTRLLDRIEPSLIARNPKLLVGFSDITALHAAWARAGVRSIHGPMAAALGGLETPLFERWVAAVEGATPEPLNGLEAMAGGKAVGPLAGGNLTVLTALIGTGYEPPLSGRVLFLEDRGEKPYRIDRMLTTWLQSGLLGSVSAIALGAFEMAEPGSDGVTAWQSLSERLGHLGVPVVAGVPSGHVQDNLELPLGAVVSVDADAGRLEFQEPAAVA